jgi:hypothetical protein
MLGLRRGVPGPSAWRSTEQGKSSAFISGGTSSWHRQGLPRLSVLLAAPSSDPAHRRANSADTYRFWAAGSRRGGALGASGHVADLYALPGSRGGGGPGLDHGLAVETVGARCLCSDLGPYSQPFLAGITYRSWRCEPSACSLRRRLDG